MRRQFTLRVRQTKTRTNVNAALSDAEINLLMQLRHYPSISDCGVGGAACGGVTGRLNEGASLLV